MRPTVGHRVLRLVPVVVAGVSIVVAIVGFVLFDTDRLHLALSAVASEGGAAGRDRVLPGRSGSHRLSPGPRRRRCPARLRLRRLAVPVGVWILVLGDLQRPAMGLLATADDHRVQRPRQCLLRSHAGCAAAGVSRRAAPRPRLGCGPRRLGGRPGPDGRVLGLVRVLARPFHVRGPERCGRGLRDRPGDAPDLGGGAVERSTLGRRAGRGGHPAGAVAARVHPGATADRLAGGSRPDHRRADHHRLHRSRVDHPRGGHRVATGHGGDHLRRRAATSPLRHPGRGPAGRGLRRTDRLDHGSVRRRVLSRPGRCFHPGGRRPGPVGRRPGRGSGSRAAGGAGPPTDRGPAGGAVPGRPP